MPLITGDDRYVAEYLYRESFGHLPPDPSGLSPTFRDPGSTLRLHSAMRSSMRLRTSTIFLRRLEASILFVVPLDRRREWYRYHGLFREFLLDELHRRRARRRPKLHLRAADWYESNGSPSRAVEHL